MRNKQHVTKEIVELYAIKASLNHYLGSERSMFEVENTTQVKQNLKKVTISLQQLNKELSAENRSVTKQQSGKTAKQYNFTELERHAIQLFNTDRRFTITE